MRKHLLSVLVLAAAFSLSAANITPEEANAQKEFSKAYNNPDKVARMSALSMLEGMHHPSSWQIVYKVATSDPDESVRFAATGVLAKEPVRDDSVARMIASIIDGVRNDPEKKAELVKSVAASPFKFAIVASAIDPLIRARYPDVPPLVSGANGGSNQGLLNAIHKQRKDYEAMLDAFNEIAKSEVVKPTKESPNTLKKWWEANSAKFAQEDRDLAAKYKKEDADAAKAAAEAKKAAGK